MPKILEQAVSKLQKKGFSKQKAFAIATSSLQKGGLLKSGTQKLTKKGRKK